MRNEGQEGGQVGELESQERSLQESVETVVDVVSVALEGDRPYRRQVQESVQFELSSGRLRVLEKQ